MKTKSITIMLTIVLLAVSLCNAQQKQPQANKQASLTTARTSSGGGVSGTGLELRDISLEGVEGSLYVGEDWPEGILTLKGGKTIENYRFRYDVYSDQMQFIAGNDTLAFASPGELHSIVFKGMTFVYEPYECSDILMKGYFQLITPGKKQLLLKRSVAYHLNENENTPIESKESYLITECYFLKTGNQPAHKVMCNRKSAILALNDKRKELEEYLKITGNKVKTLEDLKKMVEYYNSIE
jgi:hypothetical protein